MTHEIKCWPEHYEGIERRWKKFEMRLNDRNYLTNDILHIREWNPSTQEYTGRVTNRRVLHMLPGPAFGLKEGWCIMSIADEELFH